MLFSDEYQRKLSLVKKNKTLDIFIIPLGKVR